MIYILIDESGDTGNPEKPESSKDFSMAACICNSENIDQLSEQVTKLAVRLKMKEIKFSKLSSSKSKIAKLAFTKIKVEHVSVYLTKNRSYYGGVLLRTAFKELVEKIVVDKGQKVKVFMDGTENAFLRKIYEPIIRKEFPGATLRFANSMKKPMIQVADFYAGQARKNKRGT